MNKPVQYLIRFLLCSCDFFFRFRYQDSSLPIDLLTDNDHRRGLRARVVRVLFHLNPVLIQKIKPPVAPQYEPYTLQGMQLLFNWHEVL